MALSKVVEEKLREHISEISDIPIDLEIPRYDHGDFSLNIAFKLAKVKKSPQEIAIQLSETLTNKIPDLRFEAISGFINITIRSQILETYFFNFLSEEPTQTGNEKILIEYVSANPTGPLHIGHGRWAVIGDTLYRLLKTMNIDIDNEFYVNDAGNQIHLFNESIEAKKNGRPIPDKGYGGQFIDELIKKKPINISNIDFVINCQKSTLNQLKCSFNQWFKESSLHKKNILNQIKNEFQDHIYEKDNAIWFKTTNFKDDKDRVIQKENGELTYFAADIIYHLNKINRGYTHLINIWGADHHGYIKRIKASVSAKNPSIKLSVILGQLVNLYKNGEPVKMSKRTGELIELQEVIDDIGIDATRYYLLEKKADQPLDFDLTQASEKNMENPVYYIQYAHARICTILNKATGMPLHEIDELNDADRKLMLHGARYYDALYDAAHHYEVYKLTQFLYELAKLFHSFYQKNQVITSNQVHKKRLSILTTTKKIIQHCGNILGISTPEKM